MIICVKRQITVCDFIWQVTLRNSQISSQEKLSTFNIYLYITIGLRVSLRRLTLSKMLCVCFQLYDIDALSSETLTSQSGSNQSRVVVGLSCACVVLCAAMLLPCFYRLSLLEREIDALQSQCSPDSAYSALGGSAAGNVPSATVCTQISLQTLSCLQRQLNSISLSRSPHMMR